jgi:hypothetical protein
MHKNLMCQNYSGSLVVIKCCCHHFQFNNTYLEHLNVFLYQNAPPQRAGSPPSFKQKTIWFGIFVDKRVRVRLVYGCGVGIG